MIKTGKGGYQIWYLGIDIIPLLVQEFTVPNPPTSSGKFVVMDGVSIGGVRQSAQVIDLTTGTFDAYGYRWTYSEGTLTPAPIPIPYEPTEATTSDPGIVLQAANVAAIPSPGTMSSEDNAIVINSILTALKTAGIMAPDAVAQASTRKTKKEGEMK